MKLYDYFRSSAAFRVRIALNLKRLSAERAFIHLRRNDQSTPAYLALNPQGLVPALEDDGQVFTQSLAIIEYLEEICPEPALLPKDPRGRARVRGLSLIVACDAHPLIVPRIRNYLEREMHQDEAARNRWLQHWTLKALEALEAHLAKERETGRFCHGDTPTMADLCLASQVFAAGYFDTATTGVPTVKRIFDECMKIDAFDRSQPTKQPDAPKSPTH